MTRVLVTGGSTGIGRGIAETLVEAGYTVFINGRRREVCEATAAAIGAHATVGDITRTPSELIEAVSPLEHLVNNAGHMQRQALGDWTADAFQKLYDVHVVAPALLAQAFAAQCSGSGSITNIASTLAERPAPGAAPYATAKSAMVALTKQLALELAPRGIRANALLPGVIPTAMSEIGNPAGERALVDLHPMGRLGHPLDVGGAVRWLLEAPWTTGATIAIDGGLLIRE
ncbi:MAG: SDR family oxidoreductase [Myxococcota bacterium]